MASGSFMSPEQRLRALEELEDKRKQAQRRAVRAVWISIVVGAVVFGAIVAYATWQLTTVRTEIAALEKQRTGLQTDIGNLTKQKEDAVKAWTQAEQQRVAASSTLANLPEAQLKTAIEKQFAAAPRTATLLPRIYMQIVNREDAPRAAEVRKALQKAGYLVLGIETVVNAQALRTTDVRFYHAVERPEAEKIAQALRDAGESAVNVNYLKQFENTTSARPNHFEVWLAHRAD
jgi:hypothetical protein